MHDSSGLRERKKTETRRAIAAAALGLAVERGPGAFTVDDIAAAAGVSTRTVFNYFATKEAAILGVDPDSRRELLDRVHDRPVDEAPLVTLREAMRSSSGDRAIAWRTRAHVTRDHPQLQAAYIAGFTELEDDLTAIVGERLGADPATDPYPRLVVTSALNAMRVAVDHVIATVDRPTDHDVAAAIDAAFASLASGLAPGSAR